jgi:replicative DNA helicase
MTAREQPQNPPYRQPPQSLETEQALLGAILVNNAAYERVAGFLEPEHFSDHIHRAAYEAAAKLIASGKRADPFTLRPFFENAEPIRDLPVPVYLGTLAAKATTIINARDYAGVIRDLATRRQLILIGEDMVNAAYDSPVDFSPKEQIAEAETRLFSLAERGSGSDSGEGIGVALDAEVRRIDDARKNPAAYAGLSTGFPDLDEKLGGMQPGDLIVAAGRPSMGKSAFVGGIIEHSTTPVLLFSLEMGREQFIRRMISAATNIPANKLRRGAVSDDDWQRIREAEEAIKRRLAARNIIIIDEARLSIAKLAMLARRAKRQHNVGIVAVDYIQLVSGSRRAKDQRHIEVGEITAELKGIARELNVPVLALAQVSRGVENRDDKRPHLADIRESGSIEQDADVVMFLYRDEYYIERSKPAEPVKPSGYDRDAIDAWQKLHDTWRADFASWLAKMRACAGKAEVNIEKSRHGEIGTVELQFDGASTRFSSLAKPNYSDIPH